MEPAALIRQRLRRNWRRVRSCLVQSRLERILFPPPFALISFGNLDARKSSPSTHEGSGSRPALPRHPESRRQRKSGSDSGSSQPGDTFSSNERSFAVCAAEDDDTNGLRDAFGMTITSFPKAYFREHRVLPGPPPPVCSCRCRDQEKAVPSALQQQRSWHVQAPSPKALHRSARSWRCFAKFPEAGLWD